MTVQKNHAHDASDFVRDEIRWLDGIVFLHKEIMSETAGLNRKHEVAPRLHCRVPNSLTPHLERVAEKCIFAAAFLILGIGRLVQPFGERVAMVPVK